MPRNTNLSSILIFTIGVSLFGSFTTLMLALYQPASIESFSWRKPLIGSIFSLICISGLITVFFPKKCSEIFYLHKTETPNGSNNKNSDFHEDTIVLRGHHPACGRFSAHTVHVGMHVFCAACAGLFLGAVIAFMATILYFFSGLGFDQIGFMTVLVGQVGLLLGFIQFRFRGYARMFLNAFFVFAIFLTLGSIDKLAENTFIDIYLIFLIVFWLWTRITISQWDHLRICNACGQKCRTNRKNG